MKFKWLLLVISVFVTSPTFAQDDGRVLSVARVSFPAYASVDRIGEYCTREEYESSVADPEIAFEKITYMSDGIRVVAYSARPPKATKRKLPVLIFNRGSYIRNDIAYVHASMFASFVKSGFLVLAPALRGSEGAEGHDENGGKDVNDLMNLLPVIKSMPEADASAIFMYGESRGGYMTFIAARRGFPMKAAATVGALTDMDAFIKENSWMEPICEEIWPDFKTNRISILEQRSAIKWANEINVPLLIMNGNRDPQVKPAHATSLASRLQELGKPYQLVIVEGGDHRLSKPSASARNAMIVDWFKRYLE